MIIFKTRRYYRISTFKRYNFALEIIDKDTDIEREYFLRLRHEFDHNFGMSNLKVSFLLQMVESALQISELLLFFFFTL